MSEKKVKAKVRNEYIAICNERGCKFEFNFMEDDTIRLGAKETELAFVVDEEGYTWVEGGKERYIAEIMEKNQNKYHIVINGNSYNFSVETPFSFKRKKFLDKLKKGNKMARVISPMPGKIVELLCAEGDKVSQGDAILILEDIRAHLQVFLDG